VIAGFCIGRKHIFISAGIYIASFVPLIFLSNDEFLLDNVFVLPFLIIAFSVAVSAYLKLLERAHINELDLKENIFEKEKAIVRENIKWLNCKLEAKQREAMVNAMYLLEHAENSKSLIQKLNKLKEVMNSSDQRLLNNIIQKHRRENFKNYWKEFETCFLEIHPEFYKKLHQACPLLSPSELKLAALIHLGLSSKQIGSINSSSPESVDVARSRLRNKLKLPSDANLKSYLIGF
jgi:DNA-binding CsgD family transcriptional regulator